MSITRRSLLASVLPVLTIMATKIPTHAEIPKNFSTPRTLGNSNAKVHVEEWFSLTCVHCGRFAHDILPQIQKKYIDTGKVFYIFKDFPLDKVALKAAIVARSLPVDQYKPFITALLSNLDQWAFNENADPLQELQKYSILAGLSKERFQQVTHDDAIQKIILEESNYAEKHFKIDSTPTFIFNGKKVVGELTLDKFDQEVNDALTRTVPS